MTKRNKQLIGLCAALALLLGGYLVADWMIPKPKTTPDSIPLHLPDADSISEISWTRDDMTLTLAREGEGWRYVGDDRFPLDESMAQTMLTTLSTLSASREIPDVTDFARYGLKHPTIVIRTVTADGTATTLALGDQSALTGEYYMTRDGGDCVYLVGEALYTDFSHTLYDLVQKETIPAMSNLTHFSIMQDNSALTLLHLDNSAEACYNDAFHWFVQKGEHYIPLDNAKVTQLQNHILNLTLAHCVDYNAGSTELQKYELDVPRATVTVGYTQIKPVETQEKDAAGNPITRDEKTAHNFVLNIGGVTAGGVYVRLGESTMVYLIDTETIDMLLSASADALLPDDICHMDWSTVNSVSVTEANQTQTLTVTRSMPSEAASSSAPEKPMVETYTINGREIATDVAQTFFDAIGALKATATQTPQQAQSHDVLTLAFKRNKANFSEMIMTLAQDESGAWTAEFNGMLRPVASEGVEKLFTAWNALG
ncbi:MAG: DUF4340 domain-containing protein [Oscillospiraceae bacterium]